MALAVDGSSPAAVVGSTATTTTAAFSPPAGSLLVAFAVGDDQLGDTETLTVSSTGGLSWSLARRQNAATDGVATTAEVWTAPCVSAPGSITVSVTDSAGAVPQRLFVRVFTDTGIPAGIGAVNGAAAATVAYISTKNNSWGWGITIGTGAPTAGSGQTLADTDTGFDSGDSVATVRQNATTASAGTSVTMSVTGTSPFHIAAVEILPAAAAAAAAGGTAQPGQTWLRRFHHRQQLLQPGIPPAAVAAVPAPVQRPSITSRPGRRARLGPRGACAAGIAVALAASTAVPAGVTRPPVPVARTAPSRARVGPQGRNGAGLASAIVTPRGTPARPQPFVFRSPPPRRARTGRAGQPGAGIASAIITPLGSPPQPAWRQPIPRRVPDRAQVGPAGRNAAGIASAILTPLGTPGPAWRPGARSPAPRRALWRAGAGPQPAAVTTVTTYQHAPPPPRSPAPRRALWRGYGSPVVTPRGTPTSRRPVFIAPGRRTRATVGHGQVAGGIAGPQAVAPIAPQAYQHPPVQPRSPAPRRALWRGLAVPALRSSPGPAWRPLPRPAAPRRALWHGGAGPQPVTTTAAPPRQPRQPRSSAPRRALWHGLASRIVTPLGIPSRKPPPPANTPRKRQRGLWRRGAGPQPPPPSGLLAGVTAGPPASRWQAALPASRWTARPAASRWQAGQPAARYDAGNPAPRWAAGLPLQGRYSVRVVTGSIEYIPFPVSGPPGVDVTTLPLEVAIVTEAHGEPPPADPAWTAGLWLNGMAAALVDETVTGPGDYVVFGRLTATPEKPVVRAGRVRLGPAS